MEINSPISMIHVIELVSFMLIGSCVVLWQQLKTRFFFGGGSEIFLQKRIIQLTRSLEYVPWMNENSFLEVHWNISLVLVYSFFILEKLFQYNSTGLPRGPDFECIYNILHSKSGPLGPLLIKRKFFPNITYSTVKVPFAGFLSVFIF